MNLKTHNPVRRDESDPRPWLIAGTGPSLCPVSSDSYRIVSINRALAVLEKVEIAVAYHSLTIEALDGHFQKAKKVVFPYPLDGYEDYITGRYFESAVECFPVNQIRPQDRHVMGRQMGVLPRSRNFVRVTSLLSPGPSCIGALGLLVNGADITEICTVGIDGGKKLSELTCQSYRNRPYDPNRTYDKIEKQFHDTCQSWGIKWHKL